MPNKLGISKDVAFLLVAASFLPVWRSGLRDDMNFWQFVLNHTVWGDKVEYIPEEYYGEDL